jgi:glycosyltransferase involved in cell wall biosynthesis
MRVAQLVETLAAGGAEALAVDIAGGLAARGHDSHLFVLRGDGPFRERIVSAVKLHDLESSPFRGSQVARLRQFLATSQRLEMILRESGIEVLQTHLPMANFLGLVMAWRGVCRVYPTVHNNREFDYGQNSGALRRSLRRAGYRQMLRHCHGMIAVSDRVKLSLEAQLGTFRGKCGRIRVVPNGVRVPDLPAAAERAAKREHWGIAGHELLIVGAGRLTQQKNFGDLIAALAMLPASVECWRCIIAGEGELRDALEQKIALAGLGNRVRLVGLVEDLPDLLAVGDIFCLPSLYEGLPLVLLEAMAAGLPIVAYAIEGVADVVEDGVQARLVTPSDSVGLAVALESLLLDGSERGRMGAAACESVMAEHGFGAVLKQLETVYRS